LLCIGGAFAGAIVLAFLFACRPVRLLAGDALIDDYLLDTRPRGARLNYNSIIFSVLPKGLRETSKKQGQD
jgi:hypothetical protein